jgi:hypothetical protein
MSPKAEIYIPVPVGEIRASNDLETDSQENKTSKPLTIKKSIHWATTYTHNIILVEHIDDMSDNKIRSIWYDRTDFEAFQKESYATIDLVNAGKLDKEAFCTRGLETACFRRKNLQRTRRQDAWDIVLKEQSDQRSARMYSAGFIAALYEGVSALCHKEAHIQALQDREEVSLAGDEEITC